LLQIVNSAFCRLPRRISNIEQAVSYLGLRSPPDPKVDVQYLSSTQAPFDWEEAARRVKEISATEASHD
jgi:hypothetical protein